MPVDDIDWARLLMQLLDESDDERQAVLRFAAIHDRFRKESSDT